MKIQKEKDVNFHLWILHKHGGKRRFWLYSTRIRIEATVENPLSSFSFLSYSFNLASSGTNIENRYVAFDVVKAQQPQQKTKRFLSAPIYACVVGKIDSFAIFWTIIFLWIFIRFFFVGLRYLRNGLLLSHFSSAFGLKWINALALSFFNLIDLSILLPSYPKDQKEAKLQKQKMSPKKIPKLVTIK